MNRLFWQREQPRVGETFRNASGRWTIVEAHPAHGGGFYFNAEQQA